MKKNNNINLIYNKLGDLQYWIMYIYVYELNVLSINNLNCDPHRKHGGAFSPLFYRDEP